MGAEGQVRDRRHDAKMASVGRKRRNDDQDRRQRQQRAREGRVEDEPAALRDRPPGLVERRADEVVGEEPGHEVGEEHRPAAVVAQDGDEQEVDARQQQRVEQQPQLAQRGVEVLRPQRRAGHLEGELAPAPELVQVGAHRRQAGLVGLVDVALGVELVLQQAPVLLGLVLDARGHQRSRSEDEDAGEVPEGRQGGDRQEDDEQGPRPGQVAGDLVDDRRGQRQQRGLDRHEGAEEGQVGQRPADPAQAGGARGGRRGRVAELGSPDSARATVTSWVSALMSRTRTATRSPRLAQPSSEPQPPAARIPSAIGSAASVRWWRDPVEVDADRGGLAAPAGDLAVAAVEEELELDEERGQERAGQARGSSARPRRAARWGSSATSRRWP